MGLAPTPADTVRRPLARQQAPGELDGAIDQLPGTLVKLATPSSTFVS
jgi:hypothetical protein